MSSVGIEYTQSRFHKAVALLATDLNRDARDVINHIKQYKESLFEASTALNIALEIYARTGQGERVNQLRQIQQGDDKIEGVELNLLLAIRGYIQGGHENIDAAQSLIEELSANEGEGPNIIDVIFINMEGNARNPRMLDRCDALLSRYKRLLQKDPEQEKKLLVAMYKGFSYRGHDLIEAKLIEKDLPEDTQLGLVYHYASYGHQEHVNSLIAFFQNHDKYHTSKLMIAALHGYAEGGYVKIVNNLLRLNLPHFNQEVQNDIVKDIAMRYIKYLQRYGFNSAMLNELLTLIDKKELKCAVKKAVVLAADKHDIPLLKDRTHSASQKWRKANPGKFGMLIGAGVAGVVALLALITLLVSFFFFPPAAIAITGVVASLGALVGLNALGIGGLIGFTLALGAISSSALTTIFAAIGGLIGRFGGRDRSTSELQSIGLDSTSPPMEKLDSLTYTHCVFQPEETTQTQQENNVVNTSAGNTLVSFTSPILSYSRKKAISDEVTFTATEGQENHLST